MGNDQYAKTHGTRIGKCSLVDLLALMIFDDSIPVNGMMPSVLLTIWIEECVHLLTWQRKVPWTVKQSGLRSNRIFWLAKGDHQIMEREYQSPRGIRRYHSGPPSTKSYHYALIGWESPALSSGGPALDDVRELLKPIPLDLTATTETRVDSTTFQPLWRTQSLWRLLRRITSGLWAWSLCPQGQSKWTRIAASISINFLVWGNTWPEAVDPVEGNRFWGARVYQLLFRPKILPTAENELAHNQPHLWLFFFAPS